MYLFYIFDIEIIVFNGLQRGDSGSISKAVGLFDSSFLLSNGDVPLRKALISKLSSDLRI